MGPAAEECQCAIAEEGAGTHVPAAGRAAQGSACGGRESSCQTSSKATSQSAKGCKS